MNPTGNAQAGDWSPEKYNHHASFVYSKEFTTPVLSMLNPQPGEKIVDFGCGSGELTVQLQSIVGDSGLIVGIDSSKHMVSLFIFQVHSPDYSHFLARLRRPVKMAL